MVMIKLVYSITKKAGMTDEEFLSLLEEYKDGNWSHLDCSRVIVSTPS
jgi:hypothetical protein